MPRIIRTIFPILVAAVVIAAGVGAVQLAERWLFPTAQPVYIPAESLPAAGIRLETDEDLQLYPMNEYESENCIPAVESPLFADGILLFRENNDPDTEQLQTAYKTAIDQLFLDAASEFFGAYDRCALYGDNGNTYNSQAVWLAESDFHTVDHMEYDKHSGLFYLQNVHVLVNFPTLHDNRTLAKIPGYLTAAFYSDLQQKLRLVYLRFESSSAHAELDAQETLRWLQANVRIYRGNPTGNVHYSLNQRPLDGFLQYLSGQYEKLTVQNAADWERLEENTDFLIYQDKVMCVLSAARAQVVFTFDPSVDFFTEFSLRVL